MNILVEDRHLGTVYASKLVPSPPGISETKSGLKQTWDELPWEYGLDEEEQGIEAQINRLPDLTSLDSSPDRAEELVA